MSGSWVIPLRPSLSGIQLADWEPKDVAMRELGCRLLGDQRVPVGDGASLSADVYVPKDPGRSTACEIAIDTESPRPLTPGEPVPIDLPAPPYFSRNTLHYGPDSYVELHRVAR